MKPGNLYLKIQKLLPDTPENQSLFFTALKGSGRFFIDDPITPTALIATTGIREPVSFLRAIDPDAKIPWEDHLAVVNPPGAIAGEFKLIRRLSRNLGYGTPLEEVVYAQKGIIRPTQELAKKVTRYNWQAFNKIEKNAPWLWEGYESAGEALDDYPAFAIFENGMPVAIAMVASHSSKWANIGYWVSDEFRNMGYATRCAAALCAWLNKNEMKAIAVTDRTHLPSIAVIKKLGMKEYCRYGRASKLPG